MTSDIARLSRHAGKTSLVIVLNSFLFCAVASQLDAQQGRDVPAGGKVVACGPGKKPSFADMIYRPDPISRLPTSLPFNHISGIFRLMVDCKTGVVTKVIVEKSTGIGVFDRTFIKTFSQWRCKPGTWKEIPVPVEIGS